MPENNQESTDNKEERHAGGRPRKYNSELAEKICEETAGSSKSLKTICEELGISVGTVVCWLSEGHRNYIAEFAKLYARAKDAQADFLAEEILEIADDGTNDYMTITKGDMEYNVEDREVTNRSKLRVDARKWIASKLKPKKYGDKTDITSGGEPLKPFDYSNLSNEDLLKLAEIKRKAHGEQ